jgi:hypothetical protein
MLARTFLLSGTCTGFLLRGVVDTMPQSCTSKRR